MRFKITPVRFWRRIFLGVVFIQNAIGAHFMCADLENHFSDNTMFYAFCVLCVLLSPFMVVWVLGIQIVNPFSNPHWQLPTPDSNPLRLGNPLPLGHFASQLAIVSGAGYLLASMWCGWQAFTLGLTCLFVGLGWFLGLRWTIYLAGDKIQTPPMEPRVLKNGRAVDDLSLN